MAPRISIVVPTRERSEYLGAAVATCLAADDPDLEVVVSDNASADATRDVVAGFDDPRLKYVNTGRRTSMRANFEFGLAHATGDYVVMIGDDDGMLPGGLSLLRRIVEREAPELVHWSPALFEWPGCDPARPGGHARLKASLVYGPLQRLETAPLRAAAYGGTLRNYRDCPGIYHACASRTLIERIRNVSGEVFAGHVPDVYFCFSAIMRAGSYLHVDHPISIGGASPKSNGAATHWSARGGESEKLKEQFRREGLLDGERDPIDHGIRSLNAYQLSTLIVADRLHGTGGHEIDWRRWIDRIVAELALLEAAERQASLEQLRIDLAPFGQADAVPRAVGQPASRGAKKGRGRSSPTRFRLDFPPEGTVLDAARRIDRLLPAYGASPGVATTLLRPARWLRTLGRGAAEQR